MATWSYQVKYVYDNSEGSPFVTPVDITDNVITIENMTDVGTGEINTAVLQINARDGNFITETSSGATPLINQFDRIYVKITDKNSAVYDCVFEVDTIEQRKTINEGIRLVVYLMGLERGLQQVHFSKQYFYENAFNVAKDICDRYNGSKGSKQPIVDHHDDDEDSGTYYNGLPKWTANNMDFGVSETYCYNGVNDLVNKMGSSVSAGGAGDFFEFKFIDDSTIADNKIHFHAFSSGANPNQASIPTITNPANALPIYATQGTLENETGTIVFGKGAKAFGTMPTNTSKFRGFKEEFNLVPTWQSGIVYPSGARVNYFYNIYEANTDTSTSWVGGEWDQIKLGDIAENMIYSPYTSTLTKMTSGGSGNDGSDGYKLMKSSGTNPDDDTTHENGGDFDDHGCWDSNLVVRDEDHYRTWVDCKALNSGAIPSELLQDGDVYRGFRVLVADGSGGSGGSPNFSGKTNRIMRYTGSAWEQMFPFDQVAPSSAIANAQCAVLNEGKNYFYDNSVGYFKGDWNTLDKSNDCFHPASKIFSENGVATALKSTGAVVSTLAYGENSATAWEYHFSVFDSLVGHVFTTATYYRIGAWACFKLPYPTTDDDLPTDYDVGSLYTNPTLDTNNMHLTPSGETGFNASDSDELGILESLAFFIKLKYYYINAVAGGTEELMPFTGKFKMRCTCYDTSDNVVVQDFEIQHNENWEYIDLPLSAFKIYRARATRRWGNVITNLIVPELEVLEIFEWKNLKMVSIQCQESYDDVGRFAAEEGQINDVIGIVFNPLVSLVDGMYQRTRLVIDNFHFTKQLTATSGTDSSRNITPIFMERPYTTNYRQLEQDTKSQLEIEQFRYEAFDIETEGECPANLRFGDSFYLNDTDVVNASDNGANTIKLVAKKISYTINGTDGGRGGFVRKLLGVKRI